MAMRLPVVAMTGHLMWTRTGTVWATWRLNGLAKGFGSSDMRAWSKLHHQNLFQSVRGEYLILGLTADLDPVSVVNRMLENVDIDQSPAWAMETMLTLDALAERPLGKREYWLSAPLRMGSAKQKAGAAWRNVDTSFRDLVSLPVNPPTPKEILAALQTAGKLEEQLPVAFEPHRASVAEQVWIATHSQTRGLGIDNAAPEPAGRTLGGVAQQYGEDDPSDRFTSPAVFPNPLLDEGGQTDLTNKLAKFDPFSRRYLKVQNLREETTSYQTLMALAGTPKGGWETPAIDWVGRIDELGVEADWALRLNVIAAGEAARRNKRAETNLNDQLDQQDGTASITGSGGQLVQTAATLQDYHSELNRSDKEVEVQATMILAVAGPTAEEARSRAQFLQKDFKGIDFTFDIPLGAQEALWWGMQPGVPTSRQVREFVEITTGAMFASMVPLTSSELGDRTGMMLAENVTSGTARPVLLDFEAHVLADVSASIACAAEPGAGKSTLLKTLLGANHDRGARIVVIDRTVLMEYAKFAESLAKEQTAIVDLTDPMWSLDPLRVFGARAGAAAAQTLMSALLGIPARSREGARLSKVLGPEYAAEHELTSLGALYTHLQELGKGGDVQAETLSDLMGLYVDKHFGKVLFDSQLPALDLSKRAIAFLTHGVSLPDADEINNPKLFDEMPIEKLFGRAMYALLVSISRQVCFADDDDLAVFAVDEVFHITASPEGQQQLKIFYRDGRKHKAGVAVASQDARDFGDELSRGMIKTRVVMRQTDRKLAAGNLEWFHEGLGEDPSMVDLVTQDLSPIGANGQVAPDRRGEALYLDVQGRMGKIRVALPQEPERRKTVLSTPSRAITPAEREQTALAESAVSA